jgi:hypothetical protein
MQKNNFVCYFVCCETWFLTFTEEHRLRMFENREMRTVFGPKGGEVKGSGEYRRL